MRPLLLILVPLVGLGGCTSTGGGKLPVCDGKHLRSGNPYGSVLSLTPEVTPTAPTRPVEKTPEPLSAIERPSTFGSCG